MDQIIINIAIFLISAVIFTFVGFTIRKKIAESKMKSAENEAKRIIELANKEAENKKKEEIFKAKEEIMLARKELDQEVRERRGEVQLQEKRLIQKEENLENRMNQLERKEKELSGKVEENDKKKQELEGLVEKQMQELQRIANLSTEEAKKQLLTEVEKQIVKTFSFDANENYKTKVTGQGITTGGKLEVMPNFIGSSVSEVEAWASERGIVLHKEFVDSNSKYYNPNVNAGLVANQSVSMKVLVLNVKELTIYINEASNNNLGGNTPNTDNPNDNKNEDNQDNNIECENKPPINTPKKNSLIELITSSLLLKFLDNIILHDFFVLFSFSKSYELYLSLKISGLACLNPYILCFISPTINLLFSFEIASSILS